MSRTSVTVLDRSQPCTGVICHSGARAEPGLAGTRLSCALPGRSLLRLRGQVSLNDLHRDRRGCVGPEPASLDYDAYRDLWVADWREAGEHRVVEPGVVRAVLRRPGLGRDGDVREERGVVRGPLGRLDHVDHHP